MTDTHAPILTDEQIIGVLHKVPHGARPSHHVAFARAIEREVFEAYQRKQVIPKPDALTESAGDAVDQQEWDEAFAIVSAYLRARGMGGNMGQIAALCDVVVFAKAYQRQQWISIDDRLPEPEETFLAVLECGGEHLIYTMRLPVLLRKNRDAEQPSDFHRERVTYWMPLPPPPEAMP